MTQLVNYEDQYTITVDGVITRLDTCRVRKHCPNTQTGYMCVDLWKDNVGKRFYVHRLLAQHFIPNPDNKAEVNHIDGNRQNNSIDNLEWVTSPENSYHAVEAGLRIYVNRLTKDEFLKVLNDVISGESYASISERVPYKVPFLSTKVRKLSREIGKECELDASLKEQKTNRNRKVLEVINANKAK